MWRLASTTPLRCRVRAPPVAAVLLSLEHGDVYTWGFNQEGQLGLGHDADDVPFPTRVPGMERRVIRVYAGLDYSMALTGARPRALRR